VNERLFKKRQTGFPLACEFMYLSLWHRCTLATPLSKCFAQLNTLDHDLLSNSFSNSFVTLKTFSLQFTLYESLHLKYIILAHSSLSIGERESQVHQQSTLKRKHQNERFRRTINLFPFHSQPHLDLTTNRLRPVKRFWREWRMRLLMWISCSIPSPVNWCCIRRGNPPSYSLSNTW